MAHAHGGHVRTYSASTTSLKVQHGVTLSDILQLKAVRLAMLPDVSIARAVGFTAIGIPLGVAGVLLSGCARGPVLSDSADQLDADTRAVLAAGSERLGPPGARPHVLLNATRPCPGGLEQRLFQAEFPLQPGATTRVVADRATDLSLELIRSRGYRLDGPPRRHAFSMTHAGPAVRLVVRVRPGRRPAMELDARTPCLQPG